MAKRKPKLAAAPQQQQPAEHKPMGALKPKPQVEETISRGDCPIITYKATCPAVPEFVAVYVAAIDEVDVVAYIRKRYGNVVRQHVVRAEKIEDEYEQVPPADEPKRSPNQPARTPTLTRP